MTGRTAFSGMMLALLLANMLTLTTSTQPVNTATITVPDDYSTIQEAINHANEGDAIFVRNGIYNENLIVNKAIRLMGENKESTIIQAGMRAGATILSNNANISRFTVRDCDYGIVIRSSGCLVENNNIIGSSLDGVLIDGEKAVSSAVTENVLANNVITSCYRGIRVFKSTNNTIRSNLVSSSLCDGITLDSSRNNTIINNAVNNNQDNGIYLILSVNNCLRNNTASSNDWGFFLAFSTNNTIANNTANSNTHNGVYFDSSPNNVLAENVIQENRNYDVFVWGETENDCVNTIQNNVGSGNRPIMYFNHSVVLEEEIVSELILCNADNSNIDRVTVKGSDSLKNNGVVVLFTDNSRIANTNSSGNYIGIYLHASMNNSLLNNSLCLDKRGIHFDDSTSESPAYEVGAGECQGERNTYHVSTDGDNANPGTVSQPWRTIAFAANRAMPARARARTPQTETTILNLNTEGGMVRLGCAMMKQVLA